MDDNARHQHQRRITEATLGILTATYHGDQDSAEAIIAELDVDEARQVVRALAGVAAACMVNVEAFARAEPGAGVRQVVDRLMSSRPWLFG